MVLILIFRKSFHGRMSRLTGKGSTWRKKRKEPDRDRIEGAVWIFTEGEKTEPNYLKGLTFERGYIEEFNYRLHWIYPSCKIILIYPEMEYFMFFFV